MTTKDYKFSYLDTLSVLSCVIFAILFSHYSDLQNELKEEAVQLNNTRFGNQSFVLFNRNPKAGTEMLWALLNKLGHRNHFASLADSPELKKKRGSENCYLPDKEARLFYVEMFDGKSEDVNLTLPMSYCKHLNFLNFEEFNRTNPIYVNMVRHPLARVTSWYYYIRQGWYQLERSTLKNDDQNALKLRSSMGPARLKMSFEDCFLSKDPECTYPVGSDVHASRYGGSHFSQVSILIIILSKLLKGFSGYG